MFTRVHHVSYQVHDVKPVRAFFEKNFEMVPAEEGRSTTATIYDYIMYKVGDVVMDFISPVGDSGLARHLQETGPQLNHVSWATDGIPIEQLFNDLKAKGVKIKRDSLLKSPKGYIRFDIDESETSGVPLQLSEGDPLGWDDNQDASEKV